MATREQSLVLVHSPFVGPASLRPLAERLDAFGESTLVPDLRSAVADEPVHERLVAVFDDAIDGADAQSPLVLVGHSGAGPLLPAFAAATDRPVSALVFLDAGLPTPGRSWVETVPAELVAELRSRSVGSRLPPWHRWFDADPLPELVPDAASRAVLAREEPEVPFAFLTEARPAVDWTGPAGYLQLSEPYASDVAEAVERGWPVRRIETHHLAAVSEPVRVAEALLPLLTDVVGRHAGGRYKN